MSCPCERRNTRRRGSGPLLAPGAPTCRLTDLELPWLPGVDERHVREQATVSSKNHRSRSDDGGSRSGANASLARRTGAEASWRSAHAARLRVASLAPAIRTIPFRPYLTGLAVQGESPTSR